MSFPTIRTKTFVVANPPSAQALRLDKFLVERFPHISRAQLQRWITKGVVTVNGNNVTKHHLLRSGDVVAVTAAQEDAQPFVHISTIPILYEDDAILVLSKPAGLLTHLPRRDVREPTVADFVVHHAPATAHVGEDSVRPGIVHRLDRDVSGVMVVAKTQQSFTALKEAFALRRVDKEYRAIVFGSPPLVGTIDFPLTHSKRHGRKIAARPRHTEGKHAVTSYEVLRRWDHHYALLRVHIQTGRTHQIRAHLAAIDHPIVGDRLYHSRHYQSSRFFSRLFLHAHRLGFHHPTTDALVEFVSPLPDAFEHFPPRGHS